LIGDLIRSGITGVAGQINEPYLDGAVRPDVLFPAYLKGFTLAESFYLATPYLSWQTVIVGDPLCAPFRAPSAESAEPDPPLDPETELPARFSARRLAAWQPLGPPAVLKLVLLAQARSARGDETGAIETIKQAVATDGSSRFAWRTLADAYERNHQYADAAAAHRRLLELDPKDVVALNNLAYNLAVRQNEPKEAYPLAQRAIALSPNNPTIVDTLGWIQHLLGDDAHAVTSIERASRGLPRNADIQFHAAVIYAKVERLAEAAKALALAAELDPALKERSDFRELQRIVTRKN
jgi:tetratricopeptide (TPR) repeat protein